MFDLDEMWTNSMGRFEPIRSWKRHTERSRRHVDRMDDWDATTIQSAVRGYLLRKAIQRQMSEAQTGISGYLLRKAIRREVDKQRGLDNELRAYIGRGVREVKRVRASAAVTLRTTEMHRDSCTSIFTLSAEDATAQDVVRIDDGGLTIHVISPGIYRVKLTVLGGWRNYGCRFFPKDFERNFFNKRINGHTWLMGQHGNAHAQDCVGLISLHDEGAAGQWDLTKRSFQVGFPFCDFRHTFVHTTPATRDIRDPEATIVIERLGDMF